MTPWGYSCRTGSWPVLLDLVWHISVGVGPGSLLLGYCSPRQSDIYKDIVDISLPHVFCILLYQVLWVAACFYWQPCKVIKLVTSDNLHLQLGLWSTLAGSLSSTSGTSPSWQISVLVPASYLCETCIVIWTNCF